MVTTIESLLEDEMIVLPDFTHGTPKQISWALALRKEFLCGWPDGAPKAVLEAVAEVTDATWWIDHRADLASSIKTLTNPDKYAKYYAEVYFGSDSPHHVGVTEWTGNEGSEVDAIRFGKTKRLSGIDDPKIDWAIRRLGFKIIPGAKWQRPTGIDERWSIAVEMSPSFR